MRDAIKEGDDTMMTSSKELLTNLAQNQAQHARIQDLIHNQSYERATELLVDRMRNLIGSHVAEGDDFGPDLNAACDLLNEMPNMAGQRLLQKYARRTVLELAGEDPYDERDDS